MKSKQESIEISIPTSAKTSKKCASRGLWCKEWAESVCDTNKEEGRKAIFGVKVGIAVLLVSLLVLFDAPYQVFGTNIIWAILTAILVFEYTVATVTSFMKLWPSLVQYEYGFRAILSTYCLIITSGYRKGNPIKTSVDRLYSMAIGAIISVFVNLFVFPIWAGELLHNQLVIDFDSVADSLEECVKKYLEYDGCEHSKFSTTVMDEFPDEPAYRRCRNTLNSGPNLETLANSAKWEPPHGRFLHLFYPWSEYENVGAALRYCAYEVMALHSILHSQIQAPYNLRMAFGSEIQEASSQAAELVREMGRDISNMKQRPKNSLIKKLHSASERLQRSTELHAYMLTSILESKPISISRLPHVHDLSTSSNDQIAELGPQKNSNQTESYHEMMRRQSKRLYSWPSREVDAYDGDSGTISDFLLPKMRALESISALSLTNFTSTLIEFVARIDHLVHAVDKLSKMAKFQLEPS